MKWYESAVFYHMYPFGMIGASKYNVQRQQHQFTQLTKWLSHLENINITALYIGPLFESTSHGYDTKDYYQIDKRLGTNEEFKQFVDQCHKHQIKVVVDGVFNHSGKEFFAFQDIVTNREHSRYCGWYKNVDFSRNAPSGEPFNFTAWRNIYELANLNLANIEVRNYLLAVVAYWIKEFDIDGIRLDCADCLDFDFIKELRQVTNNEKANFWLMGELIHGDYSRWINEDMLHSATNYELHKALFSAHNDHNYFEIAHSIRRQFDENQGIYKGMFLYSFVDNHDVDRIASKLVQKQHLKLVYVLLYTLLGIPSIYYGSEWGIEGRKEGHNDDLLRPQLAIEEILASPSTICDLIKKLGSLKKEQKTLTYGNYRELYLTNRQYAFERAVDGQVIIVVLNNDDHEINLNIPISYRYENAFSLLDDHVYAIENHTLAIQVHKNDALILQLK